MGLKRHVDANHVVIAKKNWGKKKLSNERVLKDNKKKGPNVFNNEIS